MKKIFITLTLTILLAAPLCAAEKLTYWDLVLRMVDLERLAVLPPAGEITGQFTSYDRASRYDEATGKYIVWDANGDSDGCLEKYADGSILMADIQGPGMINHIWSASPGRGHVKIYLDGSDTPTVDLPFEDFFSRKDPVFDRETLVYKTEASGHNNWVPIPFQKSCRIVGEKDWGAYYYFQYVKFPEGTEMPAFSMPMEYPLLKALDIFHNGLLRLGDESDRMDLSKFPGFEPFTLAAGGKKEFTFSGPAAIVAMFLKPELPQDDLASRDILRGLTITIYWDGSEKPAVWSPLGDFFGVTRSRESCYGFPASYWKSGMFSCNWYMPFRQAKVVITNENAEEVKFTGVNILTQPLKKDISAYGRFHAKWHQNAFLPEDPNRKIDWTILKTTGRGRYVGVSLHVDNPRGGWWGEGDEKFFVDGEKFPSHFGTGSEDYFGYAWSSPLRFVRPFHAQPTNDENKRFIVNNRWHITDAVNFQESFSGYIEKYFPDDRPCLYSATAFWYLAPEGTDPYEPVPPDGRISHSDAEIIISYPLPAGGISDRDMMPEDAPPNLGFQYLGGYPDGWVWEGETHIFWAAKEAGTSVTMRLPAPKAGKYKLSARITTAGDYGIHQFSVNGKNVGEPVDGYSPGTAAREMEFGIVELREGENALTLTVVGKNKKSGGYQAGIDFVVLTPVE